MTQAGVVSNRVPQSSSGSGTPMPTRVVSLRLSSGVNAALAQSAAAAGLSVSKGLNRLLSNSFGNCQLLLPLADCPGVWDAKLDVRIPLTTFDQLQLATGRLGIPVSAYVRKLLYHFFVSKRLSYVRSDSHYTLAGRHD
jgi:hypothetical protein